MPRPFSLLLRFCAITVVGVVSIGLVTSLLVPAVAELPEAASFESSSNIVLPELIEGSVVLDMNGDPMGELVGTENRTVVSLDDVSEELRATVLAVEDADFYSHDGVSARSVLRALRANSEAGGVSQGGSTITQQLVKLSLVGERADDHPQGEGGQSRHPARAAVLRTHDQAGVQGSHPRAVPEPGLPGAGRLRRGGGGAGVLRHPGSGAGMGRVGRDRLAHPQPHLLRPDHLSRGGPRAPRDRLRTDGR